MTKHSGIRRLKYRDAMTVLVIGQEILEMTD